MYTTNAPGLLQQFNTTISAWMAYLADYTLDMLQKEPLPGRWSLGQVYVHIIDDTQYQVEQMKLALAHEANGGESMHPNAAQMFLHNEFPDIQIAGPATDTVIPQPQSKDTLRQALQAIKAEVNDVCNTYDLATAGGKSLHPGLLYFSAAEWLQFMEMHMRHHFRQKKRIDAILFTC